MEARSAPPQTHKPRPSMMRSATNILSIDLGSTWIKVALVGAEGEFLALDRYRVSYDQPHPGWCELRWCSLLQGLEQCINGVREAAPKDFHSVAAVTLASQANTFRLLDSQGVAITPLISWMDRRAADADPSIVERAAGLNVPDVTGRPGIEASQAPAKLIWLKLHQPQGWRHASELSFISDSVTEWFTGRRVIELATACMTGMADGHRQIWRPDCCQALGWCGPGSLPHIARAGTDLGPLRPTIAKRLGLAWNCRYVVGCLDQLAGALAAGNTAPGVVSETTGTALTVVQFQSRFDPTRTDLIQLPGWQADAWFQMAVTRVSAGLLEVYRAAYAPFSTVEELLGLAALSPPGCNGLRLNHDAAERRQQVVFDGLTNRHQRQHEVRAIMEAVASALAGQLNRLCGSRPPLQMRCVGGGARSELWLQIKKTVLGLPVVASECPEPTALGAAMLAGPHVTSRLSLTMNPLRWRRV